MSEQEKNEVEILNGRLATDLKYLADLEYLASSSSTPVTLNKQALGVLTENLKAALALTGFVLESGPASVGNGDRMQAIADRMWSRARQSASAIAGQRDEAARRNSELSGNTPATDEGEE